MFSPFHCSKFCKFATTHHHYYYYYSSLHTKQWFLKPNKYCFSIIDGKFSHFSVLSKFTTIASAATETPPQVLKKKKSKKLSSQSYDNEAYVVSYLVNTCGLSPERATFASKMVKFKSPEKPDSVLELLKKYEFNKSQISSLVRIRPVLLLFDPEHTLLPKLEFFHSLGVSRVDIAKILSRNPVLLERSLENQIIPFYKFLKGVLGDSDEKAVCVFKRQTRVFFQDQMKYIHPNLTVLRDLGVPESSIVLLMANFTETTTVKCDQFLKMIIEVKEMGFSPLKSNFVLALHARSGESNKMIWTRCFEQYKKWGWSDNEILAAFKRNPNCMLLSEKKIERTMDFLVNNFGRPSNEIASVSHVIGYSLDRRIIPRCSVVQVLCSNGLVKKPALSSILIPTEDRFLEKYVVRFEDQLPRLKGVYIEAKKTFGKSNMDEA